MNCQLSKIRSVLTYGVMQIHDFARQCKRKQKQFLIIAHTYFAIILKLTLILNIMKFDKKGMINIFFGHCAYSSSLSCHWGKTNEAKWSASTMNGYQNKKQLKKLEIHYQESSLFRTLLKLLYFLNEVYRVDQRILQVAEKFAQVILAQVLYCDNIKI